MSNQTYKPDYKSRLEAQKHRLRSSAEESKMRILNNVDYLRTDGVDVAKGEALRTLSGKSPMAGKLLGKVLGIKSSEQRPTRTEIIRMGAADKPKAKPDRKRGGERSVRPFSPREIKEETSTSKLVEEVVLPTGLAVGSSLLLAGVLRGAGKLIRGIAGKLFGGKKKKKRK